ncbi:hypothetical protein QM042_02420 [Escherichia coli]|uniref:hypothetical protein n=1 Tax=Escherichia coli TaxID=562 RepID=UPI003986B80C
MLIQRISIIYPIVFSTMLAKEIVFCHGEHAVVALPNILGAAGISTTGCEPLLVSEQVVKIIARVAKHLNHDAINVH